MNSQKTKSRKYTRVKGKAIGGIVLIPEGGQFKAYVAWEWEKQAVQGCFAVVEAGELVDKTTLAEFVDNVTDYGDDVTHREEIRKLFSNLF